jgi:predicted transcriptional regulator of viral defense system
MVDVLESLGNTPVSTSVIASLYPEIRMKRNKIMKLEQTEKIIRLKRGLYVVSPKVSRKTLSTELIANHLYSPSYISMHTALRYYDLIPEAVYTMQSMTIKASRIFENNLGRFEYLHISRESFSVGVRQEITNEGVFIIATPEKALCDLVANSPSLCLRYQKETMEYLEEDLRFDMDAFKEMNPQIFRDYIKVGKKSGSIQSILKLLINHP